MEKQRQSGILLHISSLPGDYGIGDFGKEAYNFIDFLERTNQKNWQVLPLGITSYGDSPYQSFSAFAGNPYFIDLEEFIDRGYITLEEIKKYNLGNNPKEVNYGLLYKNKLEILRLVYNSAKDNIYNELNKFYLENKWWLREFGLFMALKGYHDNRSWFYWDKKYRKIDSDEVKKFEKDNEDSIYFWIFTQYFFDKQWKKLKKYANKKEINIIGDLPIYVSEDSADVWSNPQLFNLDDNLIPKTVSGCPPDAFAAKGQLWGNPIYDWEAMEKDNYKWWIERFAHSFKLFDVVRIDHFRGFESYWEVKYGSKDAVNGRWTKGPGMKLFDTLKSELGDLNIIAEDLGFLTKDVEKLLKDSGFPGMKVLQFAFDPREESDYLPHNYNKNSVVYTGTHDNSTVIGWMNLVDDKTREYATKYLKLDSHEGSNWGFIRGAWSSNSYLALTTMQDILGLDDKSRMNIPSTIGGNWIWRMEKTDINDELITRLRDITNTYRR